MKNSEIYSLYESLNNITHSEDIKLPIKVGYILIKNRNVLQPLYDTITEARMKIITDYAENTENGFIVPEDKISKANEELLEILNTEEEVELQKIKIDNLNESLSIDIIEGLMPILEE